MNAQAWEFLEQVEGKLTTVGYIPCNLASRAGTANYKGEGDPSCFKAMGASGVTIGVGVDLGQQTLDELKAWGVSEGLRWRLKPYIGLKGDAALKALHERPLELSEQDTRELTLCEHEGYLGGVIRDWERPAAIPWDSLDWRVQAVYFSLCYQLGIGGAHTKGSATCKALWSGDIKKASRCLQDSTGWDGYIPRRAKEGRLLSYA